MQTTMFQNENITQDLPSLIKQKSLPNVLRFLYALEKTTLQQTLLKAGFSLSGKYKQWIKLSEQEIIRACQLGQTPAHQKRIAYFTDILTETKPYKLLKFTCDNTKNKKLNQVIYHIHYHQKGYLVSFVDPEDNTPKALIYPHDEALNYFINRQWILNNNDK